MGFLDKVKEQAAAAAASASAAAKDASVKGQAKLDEVQTKRLADSLLHDLGAISYGSVTNRASATAEADATAIVERLQAIEAEHGPISLDVKNTPDAEAS
jgi:hypothetical protein